MPGSDDAIRKFYFYASCINIYDFSMSINLDDLKQWVGRSEMVADWVTPAPLQSLAATLDREDGIPKPGDAVPPCWHWLYFLPQYRQSEIGTDGHPRRGGFLPPVPLPRRMWASSRLEWSKPLRVGQAITRTSSIMDVSAKEGRTGPLVFVRVRHEIGHVTDLCLVEEQDIVYRDMPKAGEAAPAVSAAPAVRDWQREIQPDPVVLFRYSALTFNGHRIHYDRPYATQVEGYPGLVVHGPLLATLLLDLLRRNIPDAQLARFAFRAMKPTFDLQPFKVCGARGEDGKSVRLWAEHLDGALAMDATATLV
jgi:3-methylfumaryl-CoA hydratase